MATKIVNDQPATLESVGALSFEAAFSDQQREELERHAQDEDYGITRRVALVVLSRSKAQLVEGFGKDDEGRESLGRAIDKIQEYIDHLKGVSETMEAAQARMFCVASSIALNEGGATPAAAGA